MSILLPKVSSSDSFWAFSEIGLECIQEGLDQCFRLNIGSFIFNFFSLDRRLLKSLDHPLLYRKATAAVRLSSSVSYIRTVCNQASHLSALMWFLPGNILSAAHRGLLIEIVVYT